MQKAIKRALVVDDSRSARISLKNLLSEYDLEISLAASGEEALEFLKKDSVDVIFMDHTMPGMDGLEAVSAIKANPKTATIPVMMYTTREGEVYVGQARALGAVGVLPKNVQPHQLFEMLLKLGLVQDRRAQPREEDEDLTVPTYELDEVDDTSLLAQDIEDQALGISVQNVVSRILEDQHVTLRSDILRSQRQFAKDVAREVLREHYAREAAAAEEEWQEEQLVGKGGENTPTAGYRIVAGVAVMLMVVTSFLGWQFKQQRDAALDKLHNLQAAAGSVVIPAAVEQASVADAGPRVVPAEALQALQWSLNQGNDTSMYDWAFSAALAEKVEGMFDHLDRLGFRGEIKLTSHLGRFCLVVDDAGTYVLADNSTPVLDCAYSGHVLDNSSFVTDRLGPEFAELMEQSPANVELNLVALYASDSRPLVPYPPTSVTAGDWNAVARQNNRVEVELIPGTPAS